MNNKVKFLYIISFLGTMLGGSISTLMSVYLPTVAKELGSSNAGDINKISAVINAVFILGWTFGGFLIGMASDRIGRKYTLVLSFAVLGVFTFATAFAYQWKMIAFCRFMSGFGMGGVLVISNTYLSEVLPAKSRSILIGILSISFPIGIFSAGLIDVFAHSWRQGFYVGIIPLGLAMICVAVLDESFAWKENKILASHTGHTRPALFTTANKNRLIAGSVIFGTMLIGLWAIFSWLPTWVQTLIGEGSGQTERGVSMMLLGIGGLAGGFFSGWFVNAAGARKSMLVCFLVCAVLSIILFNLNTTFHQVVYLQIAILALFFGASQGILSVFVPLLFPVSIRAAATGWCFNIGRIFTAAAVLFVGVLVDVFGGYANALVWFSMVFILGFIVLWRWPEQQQ